MRILGQIGLVSLLIGTSLGVSATGRVDASLVLSGTLAWSFVPVLQLLSGLLLVRGAAIGARRALEAYFATSWPWSLWIVAVQGLSLVLPAVRYRGGVFTITVLLPVAATIHLLLRMCREELGFAPALARRRVLAHQALTYALVVGYAGWAVALWPRILGAFG